MEATLLVLAGGAGRRMGRPKALLPVGRTTLVAWQVDRLGPLFAEVLVAAADAALVPAGARFAADRHGPFMGPLAGIEGGLAAASYDAVFAVACDMPRVDADLARSLISLSEGFDAAVPRLDGRPEPACACYRRSALEVVRRELDLRHLKAADALAQLRVVWLEESDRSLFWNINTPEDYQVFLSEI
ncbi:MAG TPA: molybdenum cofactor guanylyltransferase [Candidatus Dormibacteraeota bacterium]|nr:molybdenum cofactor guanylyltransferase [Candidatus Dormibacteraeota bacterium]